jgi:hypothetical protein
LKKGSLFVSLSLALATKPPPPSSLHNDNGNPPLISFCFSSASEAGSGFAIISKQERGGGGGGAKSNSTLKAVALFLVKPSAEVHDTSIGFKKHISSLLLFFHKVLFHSRKAFRARPSLHQELALLPENENKV